MLVITAGSMMHFAQALVLFAVVFSVFGVSGGTDLARGVRRQGARPDGVDHRERQPGSAAEKAGIQLGTTS